MATPMQDRIRALRRASCALLAAAVCAAASVGGAAAQTQASDNMVWTDGNGLSATTGTVFSPLVILLTQAGSGTPVADAPIGFRIMQGSATFPDAAQAAQVMTDTQGYAVAPDLTAGNTPGALVVNASTSQDPDASVLFNLSVTAAYPLDVVSLSGSGQSAPMGQTFADPLRVEVMDNVDRPMVGASVTFAVDASSEGAASFPDGATAVQVVTDSQAIATSPSLTADQHAGQVLIAASAAQNVYVPFDLTVTEPAPSSVNIVSGNNQTAPPGAAFAQPLVVKVLDAEGKPPPAGATVTFRTDTGATFPSQANSIDVQMADDGTATAPRLTAGQLGGAFRVAASIGAYGLSTNFAETVLTAVPQTVAVASGSNQSAALNQPFGAPLVASVTDQFGAPIAGIPVTFTIDGAATFGDRPAVTIATDNQGHATASGLTAGDDPGPVVVHARVASLGADAPFVETVTV